MVQKPSWLTDRAGSEASSIASEDRKLTTETWEILLLRW